MKPSTECVRIDNSGDPYGATSPPIYQTATFRQPSAVEFGEYDYTRTSNPTRAAVEAHIAKLERGTHAFAFASGMAAISAVVRLVKSGEEILAGDDLYGGTFRLLERVLPPLGISVRYVDTTDPDTVERAIGETTRLVLLETPTNPLLRVADIAAIARVTKRAGVLLAVDNSLLSPILQRPLELGADIVVHSATKFLCGHGDVIAGAVVVSDEALGGRIAFTQNAEGAGLSPFDSWLLLRGMKTLALRVERQTSTARRVAAFLKAHPLVEQVYDPGVGSVLSFTTGNPDVSQRIVEGTELFTVAVSFGGVGSVISLPCRMSHASTPPEVRERYRLPEDLVRISVGIEDADDLIDDLERTLSRVEQRDLAAAANC